MPMRPLLLFLLPCFVFSWFFTNGGPGTAWATEAWRQEFNEVCASTEEAVTLTNDELTRLVGRCDALRQQLEPTGPGAEHGKQGLSQAS